MLGEPNNQISLTRVALSAGGRAKSNFLSVMMTNTAPNTKSGLVCQQVGKIVVCSLLAVAILSSQAHAGIILFDNLSESLSSSYGCTYTLLGGQHFKTDEQTYSLTSVTLNMSQTFGSGAPLVQIWNGNSSIPATLFASLVLDGTVSGSLSHVRFSATGITLAPGTDYWVVLGSAASGSTFGWGYTESTANVVSGAPFNRAVSGNGGVNWSPAAPADLNHPYQMSVDGVVAVPEPSQWALVVFAVLGAGRLAFRHWRHQRGCLAWLKDQSQLS